MKEEAKMITILSSWDLKSLRCETHPCPARGEGNGYPLSRFRCADRKVQAWLVVHSTTEFYSRHRNIR
jgi:hypothetical protein